MSEHKSPDTSADPKGDLYREKYNQHMLHPWGNLPELGEDQDITLVTRGEGAYIYDSAGHRMIDGPAGMWCMQLGYGRQEIADAVSKQIMELAYSTSFFVLNQREVELAERIASKTPGDLNRVYFTTGGSTAVDSALRLCQLRNNIKGENNRKHIISRHRAYHGSTYLAASVTGKERDKTALDIQRDNIHFLTAPSLFHSGQGMSEEAFCDYLVQELEDKILEVGAENIMCFIAEPVLASGGVVVAPKNYLKRCWEVVKKHGIIYISDEVVTAFGRLGHWFTSEEVFGIVPDMITFAKGVTAGYLPLGGYAVSDALMAEISGDNAKGNIYSNGFTWSGNPACCAAALKSWDIMEDENIFEHVKDVGPYFQEQLRTLSDIPLVGEVRGIGLMAAVEMTIDAPEEELLDLDYDIGARVDEYCHQFGLLVRPFINICIMSPPLIITRAQVDEMVVAMRKAIELTLEDLREEGIWRD